MADMENFYDNLININLYQYPIPFSAELEGTYLDQYLGNSDFAKVLCLISFISTPFSGEIAYHPIILPTSSKGSPQLDRDLLSPKSLSGESCSTKSNSSSNWSPSGRRMSHETLSSSGGDSGFFNVPTPPGTFLVSSAKAVNRLCSSPIFFSLK